MEALFASVGSSVLGNVAAGISAVTSVMGGLYQAQVAKTNAAIAEQNAAKARQESAVQAQIQDFDAKAEMGDMLSRASASGLDIGVGSGALRRKTAEELAARDRGFTTYQGEKAARGYEQQGENFRSEASAAKIGGILGGVSSLTQLSFPNLLKDAPRVGPKAQSMFMSPRPKRNPRY